MPAILSISNLTKTYASGLQALKNVSLDICKGEIFALLGPNGAGKTTLINIVCGIVTPSSGSVVADTYEAVDYGLTSLLVRATRAACPNAVFVYLSSLGAAEQGGNAYLKARGRIEHELRDSGLPYLVVRPSFITGPDRPESRPTERLAATVVDGALALMGALGARALRDRYASMTAADLASGIVRLALLPGGGSRAVDCADLRATQPK